MFPLSKLPSRGVGREYYLPHVFSWASALPKYWLGT